jgi:FMN phosphatase YigB (HAD superfamily)
LLIIFDLDDTLIETSKCLTPIRLKNALRKMIALGMQVDCFEKALQFLLEMNQTSSSSSKALSAFAELYPGGVQTLCRALETFQEPLPLDVPLYPTEGALELLAELAAEHTLALVTIGYPDIQRAKMEKAGLQLGAFSKIALIPPTPSGGEGGCGPSKKPYYEAILREWGTEDCFPTPLVCGDRVFVDLTPAKELGLRTVHIRNGRGLQQMQPASDVDFSIEKLEELKQIIEAVSECI